MKRRSVLLVGVALVAVLLPATAALAGDHESGGIRGIVTDADGNPIEYLGVKGYQLNDSGECRQAYFAYPAAGEDRILRDAGVDGLFGNAGADVLGGGEGNDTLDGGGGRDTVIFVGAKLLVCIWAQVPVRRRFVALGTPAG